MKYFPLAMCLMTVAAAGCAVGPNYKTPESKLPDTWSEPLAGGVKEGPAELAAWWTRFKDPLLESLVTRAVESNYDLKIAEARIREARAAERATKADFWPNIGSSASYARSQQQEIKTPSVSPGGAVTFTPQGASVSVSGSPLPGISVTAMPDLTGAGNSALTIAGQKPPKQPDRQSDLFQVGLDAQWELDLFGAVRRQVEAAKADAQAAEESHRDVLVTLVAEVALTYFDLRAAQTSLDIANENIGIQQKTFELVQAKYQGGLTNELDVRTAEAQLASTRALVPAIQSQIDFSIHRLSGLIGREPGALQDDLRPAKPLPETPPDVPVGLPSDLLLRRPDVRTVERQLAAATARIGAAKADLFPRISLTGSFAGQSITAGNVLSNSTQIWSVGPAIHWPVFDAGRIRANIKIQNARQEQALALYMKTVNGSLEDVENALVGYAKERVRLGSLLEAVEANRKAYAVANELYTQGLVTFLHVLDAERSLIATEVQSTQSRAALLTDLVALYKALGGGWEESQKEVARGS